MKHSRNKQILLYIIAIVSLFILIIYLFGERIKFDSFNSTKNVRYNSPVVIWWTPIISNYHRKRQCGIYECTFTTNRKWIEINAKKAFLFYGSALNYTDLPLPRSIDHIWGLLHEESPKNLAYIQFNEVLQHFNITSTFSRYSDLPLTLQYLKNLELLTSQKYMIPIGEKNRLRITKKLAPVAFVQSICDTMSGRNEYVSELMKYIEIDSYGICLNNKKLPKHLTTDYLQKLDSDEFYEFLSKYKFIISYENGVCDDYITEKFWRPLIIGSVPIYFGAPTIRDWMPNKNSAILIEDFSSPKDLANYLHYLDENDVEYNKYLDHKYSQINPISNKLLIKTVLERDYTPDDILFENFECFVCKYLHSNDKKFKIVNQKHYNCGDSIKFPKMETKMIDNVWNSVVKYGKCEAIVLDNFLRHNKNFTNNEFHAKMSEYIGMEKCKV